MILKYTESDFLVLIYLLNCYFLIIYKTDRKYKVKYVRINNLPNDKGTDFIVESKSQAVFQYFIRLTSLGS